MMYDPLTDPVATDSSLGFFDRRECIEMNLKFAHALIAAKKRGDEPSVTYGPKVDTSIIIPTHYPKQPTQSLMSSSAATCVNAALGWEMPDRSIPMPGKSRWGNR